MAEVVHGGPIRTESSEIMNEPPDDEHVPTISNEDLSATSSLPPMDSVGDGNRNGQRGDFSGNPPPHDAQKWRDRLQIPLRLNVRRFGAEMNAGGNTENLLKNILWKNRPGECRLPSPRNT